MTDGAGVVEAWMREDAFADGLSRIDRRLLAACIDAFVAEREAAARKDERERWWPFVKFWGAVSELFFVDESVDLDYQDFLDRAEALGLLVTTPYNPDTHGDVVGDPEPGDTIYVPSALARDAAALLTNATPDGAGQET